MDVALVIAAVLPDGILVGVIEEEGHPVDALLGNAVDLVNQDAADCPIGDGDCGGFAVPDGEVGGGGVQLEVLAGLKDP